MTATLPQIARPIPRLRAAFSWQDGFAILAFLAIGAGVAFRVRAWLAERSLWLDELFLWNTLGDPSLARCLEPLGEGQIAAPGYVFLVQLGRVLLGDSELALRFPTLLCGLAALPLLLGLARRVLRPGGAWFPVALLAVSPPAIYQSAELKPYSLDLCVALVLLRLALPIVRGARDGGRARVLPLAIAGLLAVLLSLPAILVLAGIGLAAAIAADRATFRRLAVAGAAWIALFAIQHQALLAHNHDLGGMRAYWVGEGGLAAEGSGLAERASWLATALLRAFADPAGLAEVWGRTTATTWAGAILFVLGAAFLLRARRGDAALLLLPAGVTLAAAALGLYPFAGRVLQFLVPSLTLPIGAAVAWLAARKPVGALFIVAALALLQEPLRGSLARFETPRLREEAGPVVAGLAERLREGEVVYLTSYARYAWTYYAPRHGLADAPVVQAPHEPRELFDRIATHAVESLAGARGVWLLATHFYPADDERAALLAALERRGVRVDREDGSIEAPGAAAHRLDFSAAR